VKVAGTAYGTFCPVQKLIELPYWYSLIPVEIRNILTKFNLCGLQEESNRGTDILQGVSFYMK